MRNKVDENISAILRLAFYKVLDDFDDELTDIINKGKYFTLSNLTRASTYTGTGSISESTYISGYKYFDVKLKNKDEFNKIMKPLN